jgi:Methyltransferase domain
MSTHNHVSRPAIRAFSARHRIDPPSWVPYPAAQPAGVVWLDATVLTWTDERSCVTARGTEFVTLGDEGSFTRSLAGVIDLESSPDRFVLFKTRQGVERYVEIIRALVPERIVELGIFRGGSTVLLMELAQPKMLVAIDFEPEPVAALDAYLIRTGCRDSCRTQYGLDQGNREGVGRILDASFGTAPVDLVVDDASHLGPQTRASFETLFPRLRPGGLYVIEDWSWHLQGLDLPGPTMEEFMSELLAAAGRGPGLIAGVELSWDVILVRRGAAPVDPGSFAVAEWFEQML